MEKKTLTLGSMQGDIVLYIRLLTPSIRRGRNNGGFTSVQRGYMPLHPWLGGKRYKKKKVIAFKHQLPWCVLELPRATRVFRALRQIAAGNTGRRRGITCLEARIMAEKYFKKVTEALFRMTKNKTFRKLFGFRNVIFLPVLAMNSRGD